jgi:WD40 repeat protein
MEAMDETDLQFTLEENDTITSISLSKCGRFLLTNVSFKNPRLDLWDLEKKEVVRKYKGHKQDLYIIKCSFGGVGENLVLCGSSDSCVYIWSREKAELL